MDSCSPPSNRPPPPPSFRFTLVDNQNPFIYPPRAAAAIPSYWPKRFIPRIQVTRGLTVYFLSSSRLLFPPPPACAETLAPACALGLGLFLGTLRILGYRVRSFFSPPSAVDGARLYYASTPDHTLTSSPSIILSPPSFFSPQV